MLKYILLDERSFRNDGGLTHVKDRCIEFLKVSILLHLIPVMPKLPLCNLHSKKQNCFLHEYIQIPDFVLLDLPPETQTKEVFTWTLKDSFIPNDELFLKYKDAAEKMMLNLKFLDKYESIARNICSQLNRPLCVLHVRRGDYLQILPRLKNTTSPEHIKNILQKHSFADCYIHTNENQDNFFDSLKDIFSIKLFSDFQTLKEINETGDNYALYAIECCIRDLADIRISTFNTTESDKAYLPNNDSAYFSDYLDETKGWQ